MKRKILISKFVFLVLVLPTLTASMIGAQTKVRIEKVQGNIYKIIASSRFDVNLLASVGEDGVLLVDTGFSNTAEELLSVVRSLGELKIVVNTHHHFDHAGGNRLFAEIAPIIAHKNVRKRLTGEFYGLKGYARKGLPLIGISEDTSLFFNGEEIRLSPLKSGHTDGDVIVYFTKSKVVHVGDAVFADSFPFIDNNSGGDAEQFVENLKELCEYLPSDIRIITGHGPDYTLADLKIYSENFSQMITLLFREFDNGKGIRDIASSGALDQWKKYGETFINRAENWIGYAYGTWRRKQPSYKESIAIPLTYTISSDGINAAVEKYYKLRNSGSENYDFSERELNLLGYQLLARNLTQDAIAILKLNAEAYPDSANVFDSLGEAYLKGDDVENAIKNYNKSLKLNPNNTNAIRVLKALKKEK